MLIYYAYFLIVCRVFGMGYNLSKNSDKFIENLINNLIILPFLGRVLGWW